MRQAGDRRRRIIDVHITARLNRVTDVSTTPGNMLFGPLSTLAGHHHGFNRAFIFSNVSPFRLLCGQPVQAAQLRLSWPCGQPLQAAQSPFTLPCGQGLHSAQLCFRLPCGQPVQAAQLCFRLPCGQPLQAAQWSFRLPCGQGLQAAQLKSSLPCGHRFTPIMSRSRLLQEPPACSSRVISSRCRGV